MWFYNSETTFKYLCKLKYFAAKVYLQSMKVIFQSAIRKLQLYMPRCILFDKNYYVSAQIWIFYLSAQACAWLGNTKIFKSKVQRNFKK